MTKNSKRGDAPRRAINTKITDNIRARLEASSKENGRTMSAEVEWRLVRSFIDDKISDFDEEMNKDPATSELLGNLRAVLGTIFRYTEKSWSVDQPSRDQVAAAVGVILMLVFRDNPIRLPEPGTEERKLLDRQRAIARGQGKMIAISILASSLSDTSFQEFVDFERQMSGYVDPGPDTDYENLRAEIESLSSQEK